MVSLGGLSAVFPGYQDAEKKGAQTRLLDAQAQEYDLDRAGEAIWGTAFPYLRPGVGGVSGMGVSRPVMQPGQPSVPMEHPAAFAGANITGLPPMPQFIQERAQQYGHDPKIALQAAQSEGLDMRQPVSFRPGDNNTSFGPYQLHVGGGLGDTFQQQTGLDPRTEHYATTDWALRNLGQTGWGPYHGVANRYGYGPRTGVGTSGPPMADALQGQRVGIQDAIAAIERAAPNASPEMKMRALNKALPHIREEERAHIADMNAQYQQERIARQNAELELSKKKLDDLNAERARQDEARQQRIETAKEAEGRRGRQFAFSQYKYGQTREDKIEAARLKAENDKEMIMLRDKLRQEFKMPPNMDVEDLRSYAERLAGGEKFSPNFLGTGNQGNANKALFAHILRDTLVDKGMNPEDIRKKISEEIGRDSAQRAIGTMGVKIDSAATELDKLRGPAEKAIDALGDAEITRGPFKSWNMLLNMRDDQISDPRYIQLKLALKGVSAAYAQVLRRGAGMTVEAQKAADKYLDDRWGAGGLKAGLAQMKIEADQVRAATREAKENVLKEDANIGTKSKAEPLKPITQEIYDDMQDALLKGKPFDLIIKRLEDLGYDTKEIKSSTGKRSDAGGDPNAPIVPSSLVVR